LYLLHGFVLGWVWQHARDWHYTGAWLITLAAVSLSWISYRLIERPGIKLGYRIGKLIEQLPAKEKSRA
jgi:peptidoglycan/LPS O-acetylase OafA/YrhL